MPATMATASAAPPARTTSAATTSSAATARPAASPAISTAIWTVSGSTVAPWGNARHRIPIEVRFVVGEISAAFDGQRRCSRTFAVALVAAVRAGFAATHLGALFFEDGFA
jgi:hypothetical protein